MKKLAGILSIFSMLLFIVPTYVSGANKERFCNNYADTAVDQYDQAKQYRLPNINSLGWSNDRNSHFLWCMMTPENIANNENARRQVYLNQYLQENNNKNSNNRPNNNSDSWQSNPVHTGSGQAVGGTTLPKSVQMGTQKNASRHPVIPNFVNTERDSRLNNKNNFDNRKTDDGSDTGTGHGGINGGIGGMANKPGGNWEPGSGNGAPPFEEDNGLGDMYGNKAGRRPDDHIKDPDQMGSGDVGSPATDLYGPTGKPLPGFGSGKPKGGTDTKWVKKNLREVTLIFGGDLMKLTDKLKKMGKSTDIDGEINTKGPPMFFIKIHNNGSIHTFVYDLSGRTAKLNDHSKKKGKSLDGSSDEVGKDPLSPKEKEMINDAKAAAAYDNILNYIPILNDGGVVDPAQNQANGESGGQHGEKNNGHASGGHGKAPQIAKQPGSHRPGSDLTGPGRIDRPKPGKNVKLPQGFHVIDPAALKGAVSDRVNSGQDVQDIQIVPHRVK